MGCAQNKHHSQSRPRVVAHARDSGETLATTGTSCRRRYAWVGNSVVFSTSASVKPSQPNNSASALVKNHKPSSSTGGSATAPPSSSNNKSKSKAKSVLNGPHGKAPTPVMTQVQINGAATLVKSSASAAIIEATHAHPNGDGSLATRDRNEFVREVLSLINVRPFPSFHLWRFLSFPVV